MAWYLLNFPSVINKVFSYDIFHDKVIFKKKWSKKEQYLPLK